MSYGRRGIFRPEALRRYAEGQEKAVLPRLASPRVFRWLWALLALLLSSLPAAWLALVGRLVGE